MTVTLYWWIVPLILLISAVVVFSRSKPDYDFVTPLIAFALLCGAVGTVIGHFL